MASLSGDDPASPLPGPDLDARLALRLEIYTTRRKRRRARDGDKPALTQALGRMSKRLAKITNDDSKHLYVTALHTPAPFRERLVHFWTDHFTVSADNRIKETGVHDLIHNRIRPHVVGRFSDMLVAVTEHPEMLNYLNQSRAVGPNSDVGKRRNAGLNENLAREILELHTLGVGGAYTQTDVREFAELLTGMSVAPDGFAFRHSRAEPGAETVLGTSYGSNAQATLKDVRTALRDLARHPQTARHLARKLVVHFLSAPADDALVERMADAYLNADTRLQPMYRAMINAPQSWELPLRKAKTPFEFIISTLRALDGLAPDLRDVRPTQVRNRIRLPMSRMGQPFLQPSGPDGWPEAPETWITPSGLAQRIDWASDLTQQYARDVDPRAFVEQALGPVASPLLERAVAGSETRHEGVALALVSPEFNRR